MIRFGNRVNLIVCQKSKVQDWVNHFLKCYNIVPFDLTKPKRFEGFSHWFNGQPEHINIPQVVGIINYELIWRRKELLNLENFTLMLDESSMIQNATAKRTKFILKLKPSHVILLSGTPVGGKYENLWSQGHLLGWKISHDLFDQQYINWEKIEVGGVIHKIVNRNNPYKNTDRLKQKLNEHGCVFLKTEDVMDLPEQVFQTVTVSTSKEYRKFQKNSIVAVEDLELVGDTTLTKLLYSRQLCGQYNNEKVHAFEDLIGCTQDRLIVFYNFDEELIRLKAICQLNGKPTSEINGHRKDLTAYEQETNSVTLVQYQSGSMGLNLQLANRIVYFTLPLSSELFEQSKKRIHRIGQNRTCFYYLMICRNSVEEDILRILEERRDYTDALFCHVS